VPVWVARQPPMCFGAVLPARWLQYARRGLSGQARARQSACAACCACAVRTCIEQAGAPLSRLVESATPQPGNGLGLAREGVGNSLTSGLAAHRAPCLVCVLGVGGTACYVFIQLAS
jgi:hypothetical protein